MNTPVAPLFENDEYYQTFMSPFPVVVDKGGDRVSYKGDGDGDSGMEWDRENAQPDLLVRLYLGSLTIVGLYILFRVLD